MKSILAIHRISLRVPTVRERCGGLSAGTAVTHECLLLQYSVAATLKKGGFPAAPRLRVFGSWRSAPFHELNATFTRHAVGIFGGFSLPVHEATDR